MAFSGAGCKISGMRALLLEAAGMCSHGEDVDGASSAADADEEADTERFVDAEADVADTEPLSGIVPSNSVIWPHISWCWSQEECGAAQEEKSSS